MIPERSLEWALDISNVLYMQNYKYISIIMSVPVMEVVRLLGSPEMSLKEPKRALWFQRGVLDVLDISNCTWETWYTAHVISAKGLLLLFYYNYLKKASCYSSQ